VADVAGAGEVRRARLVACIAALAAIWKDAFMRASQHHRPYGRGASRRGPSNRTCLRLNYANVVSTLALFLALSGGTALALTGSNTVTSDDIVNGQVKTGDLAGSSVATGKVADNSLLPQDIKPNSLGGARIDESRLGQVPSALLGGKGHFGGTGSGCDPQVGEGYVPCASVLVDVPAPARVAVIGSVLAHRFGETVPAVGLCRIGANVRTYPPPFIYSGIPGTQVYVDVGGQEQNENVLVQGITDQVIPAGEWTFRIDCNEEFRDPQGNIEFIDTTVSAVALSPE
jgi:hypothetical protein